MSYSLEQLMQIEQSVGERHGWDFTRVNDGRDPVPWDYPQVIRSYLKPTDVVLDVGTGGGEKFLALADGFSQGYGVDNSPAMIQAARANLSQSTVDHVTFSVMDAYNLEFDDASFDMVLNRQSVIAVEEVLRVLRPSGYFITQAVGHRNTQNIFQQFGWTMKSFDDGTWLTTQQIAQQFREQGASIRSFAEYDVPYWFEDVESLVFWLKAVPLPESFDMKTHWQQVNQIIDVCKTDRGIETNEHRELLIVQK